MVVADLHVHTTASDGCLSLADVPAAARRADVDVVAITDHDRPHPDLDGAIVDREGITVLHGIELRVELPDQRVDLLAYGLESTAELQSLCDRIQRDRVARGRAMVERIEDRLGVTLPVEIEPGIGRPDVARAVAAVTEYDVQGVFDDLIGNGRPCYVERQVPTFERGRRVLAASAAIVGLAHPLRYADTAAALDRCGVLDALELYYPYDGAIDPEPVERAIERHDLLATGGSDAHDECLGKAGLDRAGADRVLAALDALS